jgi:methyl-accepting chemotaxis protein
VPVFKLEKWASLLAAGKLTAVLRFREKDEMKDLSDRCNESVLKIRTDLLTIKRGLEAIRQNPDSDQIGSILEIIGRMELDPDIIEIKTASIEYSKAKSR